MADKNAKMMPNADKKNWIQFYNMDKKHAPEFNTSFPM